MPTNRVVQSLTGNRLRVLLIAGLITGLALGLLASTPAGGPRNTTELYEHVPATPTWGIDAAMPTDCADFAATLLSDGRVLATQKHTPLNIC